MPLREDLLNPLSGDNPSGIDIRYDTKYAVYDKIREARREEDDLAQGDWQHERKVADYSLVAKLSQEALASASKDLQLAAWLTEAMLKTEGFSGLSQGLTLCLGLLSAFWDTVYPLPEEGDDVELRAKPLSWLGSILEYSVKSSPITSSGYGWLKYEESRAVGYEDQVKSDKDKKLRARAIEEGKLAPEVFDKAFVETRKEFYQKSERDIDSCREVLSQLETLCDERFGNESPSFGKLKNALEQVRHTVHLLLQKKRETEPDPIEPEPLPVAIDKPELLQHTETAGNLSVEIPASVNVGAELSNRAQAVASVAVAAAFLRKQEPLSPAPYLMMRGLRWGELRSARHLSDSSLLEAPSTELRQQIKRLALAKKWKELIECAEDAMSLPCSRAWLDLQRLVVGALTALGDENEPIAAAIRSELRALLNDLPELLDAILLDDTPAANSETRTWLRQLQEGSADRANQSNVASMSADESTNISRSWLAQSSDAYVMAKDALKAGQQEKAFAIMRKEIALQRSGRGRFERTMQLIELCAAAGKDAIAQPLLDDIATSIESHKLDEWEDPEMVASALATLMKMSRRVQDSSTERQRLFERICRLDPVQALSGE